MKPLPDRYTRRPVRLETFAGDSRRPSRHEISGPLWRRPHRGVVAWFGLDENEPVQRVLSAAAALPGVPLGTWAAALVHGAQDVDGEGPDGKHLPVVFCPGTSGARARRPGLEPLRSALSAGDVVTAGGVLVTSPVRTAFDLARTAGSLADAVADVDALLRATSCRLTVPALRAYCEIHPGWRGVRQVRDAVPLLNDATLSRPESRLRVIWVQDAGLRPPRVNMPVFSRRTGRSLGLPDLLDAESGLVAEYDGAYHRELGQHSRDNVREERFEDAGLTVVRFTAVDLRDAGSVARRLRAGHERARRQQRRGWFVL